MEDFNALPAPESGPLYFSVASRKFIVMSLTTLRIYNLYWFYRNWKTIKSRTGEGISPFWRAFFSVFFCHSLIEKVNGTAKSMGIPQSVNPTLITSAFILLSISWKLPDPFWLISLFTFVPLLSIQASINRINQAHDPRYESNGDFSIKNIAAIFFGGIFLMMAIIGTFMGA
jgi:hypothetical protein